MTATTPPPLPADLNEGPKRLKMAAMRRLAPELLFTAKTRVVHAIKFGTVMGAGMVATAMPGRRKVKALLHADGHRMAQRFQCRVTGGGGRQAAGASLLTPQEVPSHRAGLLCLSSPSDRLALPCALH